MTEKRTELHILNGDFALELWNKCRFPGESLVWRETYLEGPLPPTDDLHIFRSERAAFLAQFAELSGVSLQRLTFHLQKMDDAVLELPEKGFLMLWFDSCIFDQTLLMRILYLLNLRKIPVADIFLYCCNSNSLTLEDFKKGASQKIRLLPQDLESGAKAWVAFQRRNAKEMIETADTLSPERLPQMKKALLRCAEELPDQNGMTRTQRQILQLVNSGCRSFMEIFKGLDAFEEYPFLGDTACQRHLEDLVQKGFLEASPDGSYSNPLK